MSPTATTYVLFTAVAATWFVVFGLGHFRDLDRLHAELDGCYARAEAADAEIERASVLARLSTDLESWDQTLAPLLQRRADAPPLLLAAQSLLRDCGLSIERAESMPSEPTMKRPNERIRAVVTGAFGQVFDAVARLENGAPPTRITDLTLQAVPEGNAVRVDLVISRTWQEAR